MIFLSYRRTDAPQACRVYDWLTSRFGKDAVFMDVAAIPYAVQFPAFIRDVIEGSKVLIVLIGSQWAAKMQQADDPVRMELETAMAGGITLLPVLIGNTPMPNGEDLPASIASIASQNAVTVGVLHDFETHMQMLLPRIESILGMQAATSVVTADPDVIVLACEGIVEYLGKQYRESGLLYDGVGWLVADPATLARSGPFGVTLSLHRVTRFAEVMELHFILSFWSQTAGQGHSLAGWVLRQLERTPLIPEEFFAQRTDLRCELKIRLSDEDPRQIWKVITSDELRLSLAYVATVSPRRDYGSAGSGSAPLGVS